MERLTTEDYELIGCHGCEEKGVCYARYWCSKKKKVLIKLKRYEDTGLTPDQTRGLAERDTAKAPEEIQDAYGDTRLICPNCRNSVINYFNRSRPPQFCMICGQRLKWEEG